MKIDFAKSVKENMHYVNKYNILLERGKKISYCIIMPVFFILGIWCYYDFKVPFFLWIFLFVVFIICAVTTYWIYKKIYDANIHTIKKSLEELSELEEDEDAENTSVALDDRLTKNEMLNKRMAQGTLFDKMNKSLNKLINMEMSSIFILFLVPFCIWAYGNSFYENMLSRKILFIVVIAVIILGIIWNYYKLKKCLMKIDFSKGVEDNMHYLNKYNTLIKKEKIASYFIVVPVFLLLGFWYFYGLKINYFPLWMLLFVALTVATVITYLSYKMFYDKNIQSIKKGLEEQGELEK